MTKNRRHPTFYGVINLHVWRARHITALARFVRDDQNASLGQKLEERPDPSGDERWGAVREAGAGR